MNTNEPLDGFERSLLTELRAHVADGVPATTRRTSRGWIAGGVTFAVAAVAVAAVALTAPSTTAFAVEPESNGAVVVHVYRLADAPLLEKALARAGVKAAVSYAVDVPVWARDNDPIPEGLGVMDADDFNAPWDPSSCTIWASLDEDGVTVRIPARAVGAEPILRIELAGSPDVRQGQETMVIGFDQPPC